MHELLNWLLSIDGGILIWIQNNLRFPELTTVMRAITSSGNHGLIWIILSVVLLIPRRTRRVGILALIALLAAHCVCNLLIKDFVARPRPYEAVEGLHRLIEKQPDYSFPSGHAATAFAAGVMIFKGTKRPIGVPVLIFSFVIAFSRLYVGVHYPSDVIAGAVIGTVIACILFALFGGKRLKSREKRRKKKKKSW